MDQISHSGAISLRLIKKNTFSINEIAEVFSRAQLEKMEMSSESARVLIKVATYWFRKSCELAGHDDKKIRALTTKFRDAGRRSAPWKAVSSRVPGRPQDGSDGNRINRWLLPPDHKFFANEVNATLVEVKYLLQAMSMLNAPKQFGVDASEYFFNWLISHSVKQGEYLDPVQLEQINFNNVIADPRLIQSGHIFPLDRGGRHVPDNTFLMLHRSNQIQGNLTLDELIALMSKIVSFHKNQRDLIDQRTT